MSDIPPDLLSEILLQVPVQPLLRFRCVCKLWRRIIDDPAFSKSHRHRHRCSTVGTDQLILRSNESTKLCFVPLDSLKGRTRFIAINRPQFTRPGSPRLSDFPVASCDGMILLSHLKLDKAWKLWNPFNGDFFVLPRYDDFTEIKDGGGRFSGIWYDSVSDDYKIVRIASIDTSNHLETLVNSLKLGYWRRIKDFTDIHISFYYSFILFSGVFADGALHWLIPVEHQGKNVEHIIAFDIETEDYGLLPLPPAIFV